MLQPHQQSPQEEHLNQQQHQEARPSRQRERLLLLLSNSGRYGTTSDSYPSPSGSDIGTSDGTCSSTSTYSSTRLHANGSRSNSLEYRYSTRTYTANKALS